MKETTLSPQQQIINIFEEAEEQFETSGYYSAFAGYGIKKKDYKDVAEKIINLLSSASPYRMFEAVPVSEPPPESGYYNTFTEGFKFAGVYFYDANSVLIDKKEKYKWANEYVTHWLRPVLSSSPKEESKKEIQEAAVDEALDNFHRHWPELNKEVLIQLLKPQILEKLK